MALKGQSQGHSVWGQSEVIQCISECWQCYTSHIGYIAIYLIRHEALNVLARLSGVLNVECKLLLFYSFILSHFEHSTVIWHFYSRNKMKKWKNYKRELFGMYIRAFNSCCTALLDRAKVSTLYVKRLRSMLSLVCKTINSEGPMCLNNMFTLNQNSHSRKHISLIQPKFNTKKYGFNSIRYQGSRLWNQLDNEYRINDKLKGWEPHCTCATCGMCVSKEL